MLNFFPCILWLLLHAGGQWLTDSASDKVAGQQCAFWHGALLKEVFNYFSQLNSANLNLHFSFAPLFSATFSSKFFVHCSALSKKFSNLRISVGEHHHHHRRHHHHCRRRRRRHQLSFHVAWQHDLALSLSLAEKSNAVFCIWFSWQNINIDTLFCFVLFCFACFLSLSDRFALRQASYAVKHFSCFWPKWLVQSFVFLFACWLCQCTVCLIFLLVLCFITLVIYNLINFFVLTDLHKLNQFADLGYILIGKHFGSHFLHLLMN